jgi:LmbE family N-acetylglucosaminyl deacetylase
MDLTSLMAPPAILAMRRILVIQPHADDGEVGAGATLARLIAEGAQVYYLTVADDRVGSRDAAIYPEQLARIRVREEEDAMRILGVLGNHWLGWRDSEVQPTLQLREQMIREIRTIRPDVVMTMDPWLPYEAHPDHLHTGLMAAQAALLAPQPYVDALHLREGIEPHQVEAVAFMGTARPNTFIDVTDTFETKLRAIRAHESQFSAEWDFYETYLTFKAQQLAQSQGLAGRLVEAFKVLRPLHLHYNVDAETM